MLVGIVQSKNGCKDYSTMDLRLIRPTSRQRDQTTHLSTRRKHKKSYDVRSLILNQNDSESPVALDEAKNDVEKTNDQQQSSQHASTTDQHKQAPLNQKLISIFESLQNTSIVLNPYSEQYRSVDTEAFYYFPDHEMYNVTMTKFRTATSQGDETTSHTHEQLLNLVVQSLQFCESKISDLPHNESHAELVRLELHELNLLLEYLMFKSMVNAHLALKLFKTVLELLPTKSFQFTDNFMIYLLRTIDEKWSVSTPYVLSMIMDAFTTRNKNTISSELYSFLFSLIAKSPTNCSRSEHELLSVHGLLFHMNEVNSDVSVPNEPLLVAALDTLLQLKDDSVFQIFDEFAIEKPHLISHRTFEKVILAALLHPLRREQTKSEPLIFSKMMHYIHLMESKGYRIVEESLLRLILKQEQLRTLDTVHIFLRHAPRTVLLQCFESSSLQPLTSETSTMHTVSQYIHTVYLRGESSESLLKKLQDAELWERDHISSYFSSSSKNQQDSSKSSGVANDSVHSNTPQSANPQPDSSNDGSPHNNLKKRHTLNMDAAVDFLKSGKCKRIYYDSNNIMYRGEMRQHVLNRDNQAVLAYMLNLAEKINTQYNIEQSHLVFDYHDELDGERPKSTRLWKARPVFLTADDMLVDMAKKLSPPLKKDSLFVTGDIALQLRLSEQGVLVASPAFFSHPSSHVENVVNVENANLSRLMRL